LNYTRKAPRIVASHRCAASRRAWLAAACAAVLAGCAGFPGAGAIKVNLVGVEQLPGEGMELRFLAKLRVQNAGETAVDFDGIALELDLRGMSFASGVSDERGTVPRFGERVIAVPMTISAVAVVRQALSLMADRNSEKIRIDYAVRGRLGGSMLGGGRFENSGQIDWPPAPAAPTP